MNSNQKIGTLFETNNGIVPVQTVICMHGTLTERHRYERFGNCFIKKYRKY
jgi:hypothetical protein